MRTDPDSMENAYFNGRFLSVEAARASVMDRGFLFGDGVYEVIPIYGKRLFQFDAHMVRLARSLAETGIENPLTAEDWFAVCDRLSQGLDEPAASLYLQVTRGTEAIRDHAGVDSTSPTVFAAIKPLVLPAAESLEQGYNAVTLEDIRWARCDIKTIALLPNVMARRRAKAKGAAEAILIRDGMVTEGAASNVFIVHNGMLRTPPKSNFILWGITRDMVLNLASNSHIPCQEADIKADVLETADEIWLTSSTREILPVTKLNGQKVGNGQPGPLWRRMYSLFQSAKTDC